MSRGRMMSRQPGANHPPIKRPTRYLGLNVLYRYQAHHSPSFFSDRNRTMPRKFRTISPSAFSTSFSNSPSSFQSSDFTIPAQQVQFSLHFASFRSLWALHRKLTLHTKSIDCTKKIFQNFL